MKIGIKTLLLVTTMTLFSGQAMAQLNNKPFQFKNAPTGMGMSDAGKQAIINERLYDLTPRNIIRGLDGQLLSVEEGRGKSAFVRYDGTNTIIPSYKGSDFRNENDAMRVGVFNGFFTQDSGRSSSYSSAAYPSYNSINTWTGRVAAAGTMMENMYPGPVLDVVDAWTGQVMVLSAY